MRIRSMLGGRLRSPVAVAIASLAALLLACVLVFPAVLVRMDFDGSAEGPLRQVEVLKARNDVRTTLLQGLGTLVAVAGIIATLRVNNERGQTTERFVSAVDQLGNDRLEVRIGGIYALERIARDSREDHPTIMEILTGFIRGHSPWPPAGEDRGAADAEARPASRPTPPDVQAAMTVVGRRDTSQDPAGMRLDLSAVDLRGLVLLYANLRGVRLRRANLQDAGLSAANLRMPTSLGQTCKALTSVTRVSKAPDLATRTCETPTSLGPTSTEPPSTRLTSAERPLRARAMTSAQSGPRASRLRPKPKAADNVVCLPLAGPMLSRIPRPRSRTCGLRRVASSANYRFRLPAELRCARTAAPQFHGEGEPWHGGKERCPSRKAGAIRVAGLALDAPAAVQGRSRS
jgi:hypothetical protein